VRDQACRAVFARAVKILQEQGATVVDVRIPNQDKYGEAGWRLMVHGLKHNLAAWLADYAPTAPVRSLADVIAFNEAHADRELALFGQEFLVKTQSKPLLDAAAYERYASTVRRYAGTEGVAAVLAAERLDALIGISSIPGWRSDGRPANDVSFTSPAAAAGYPHVTVPAGLADGMPVGLSFVGGAWRDADMLGLAYAFEQAAQARVEPLTYLYD
jgi:amidase